MFQRQRSKLQERYITYVEELVFDGLSRLTNQIAGLELGNSLYLAEKEEVEKIRNAFQVKKKVIFFLSFNLNPFMNYCLMGFPSESDRLLCIIYLYSTLIYSSFFLHVSGSSLI